MIRILSAVTLLLSTSALVSTSAFAAPLDDPALEAKARAIHDKVMTLDTHVDIPMDFATAATDPGGFSKSQVDLPKMRAGGLDAAFFIVFTPYGPLTEEGYRNGHDIAMTRLKAIHRMAGAYPKDIGLARSVADAHAIARSGRKVAFIGVENAYPLGAAPTQADIDHLAEAGVRYAGITHFGHNQFGDSSNPNKESGDPEEKWGGLSPLGRDYIPMLNRAGIMVDVSHSGRKTMLQATELSAAPIIASHSGVKAVADVARNLDDEQLQAIAAKNGVAQIVALDVFLKPMNKEQEAFRDNLSKEMGLETPEAREAASEAVRAEYEKRLEGVWAISPRATVSDFVNHIDHAVKIAGVDHVGIASDFDGGGGIDGWEDATETLNVTRELVRRGYSEEDIAKIWSGNLLRVLGDVEKVAKGMKK